MRELDIVLTGPPSVLLNWDTVAEDASYDTIAEGSVKESHPVIFLSFLSISKISRIVQVTFVYVILGLVTV